MVTKVTTKIIAQELGLARSTVSQALRNHSAVKPATRQRVWDKAKQLNYRPNAIARAMVTGRTQVMGFIAHQMETENTSHMFSAAVEQADTQNYFVKPIRSKWTLPPEQMVARVLEQRLCAVILRNASQGDLEEYRRLLEPENIPIALLGNSSPQDWGIRVTSDDDNGIRQAIDHLWELGHRRIGYMGFLCHGGASLIRLQAFGKHLRMKGLDAPEKYVVQGELANEPLTQKGISLLMNHVDGSPTALLCSNDILAMQTIRIVRRMGIDIPQQLSIIGYSNLLLSQYCDPAMTTVSQPFNLMGQRVVELLIQAIETGARLRIDETIPTELVVRDSTAAPSD